MKNTPALLTAALLVALTASASAKEKKAAQNPPVLVRAQGHPLLHSFEVMSNKRADLRLARATKSLDVAFTDWLRTEKPHVYKQDEAKFYARLKENRQKPPEKRAALAK